MKNRLILVAICLMVGTVAGCKSNEPATTLAPINNNAQPINSLSVTEIPDELFNNSQVVIASPTSKGFGELADNKTQGVGMFSMSTANIRKPIDVREHVDFYAGGGGGPPCELSIPEPNIQMSRFYQDVFEVFPISQLVYRAKFIIYSCGWTTDKISATLNGPHGETFLPVETTLKEFPNNDSIRYQAAVFLEIDNPQLGNHYTLQFEASDGSLTHDFSLVMPSEPKRYKLEDGTIVLWNFYPKENVRFYAYKKDPQHMYQWAKFVGYQDFVIDEDGKLFVSVDDPDLSFSVVGEVTGEVSRPDILEVLITE